MAPSSAASVVNQVEPSPRRGVICAGLWLIDYLKQIDHYPEPSRLAKISEVERSNGGGAFNVAIDLAKLGCGFPIKALGMLGQDPDGDWIVDRCRSHGIDTAGLARSAERATAFTDVMTEAQSGRRTFFYQPGANELLDVTHLDLSGRERIFYLGYPGLLPKLDAAGENGVTGISRVLQEARARGFITATDLVSADSLAWKEIAAALPHVDLLFVNEMEAARLLGRDASQANTTATALSLEAMGRDILKLGPRRAVVLHSEYGAVCVDAEGNAATFGAIQVPADEIRGACGAGDALAAGFLHGFHQGWTWARCLELGVSAAATCLHHLSSSEGIKPWQDCLAYGQRLGSRNF